MNELGPRMVGLWNRGGKPGRTATPGARSVDGPTPTETGLPPQLEPQLTLLTQSESGEERRAAARALLGHVPVEQTPPYVRALALFQLAERCPDKRKPLTVLEGLKDRRALPALVLASERAKTGCRHKDCLACMRGALERLIAELEALEPGRMSAGR